MTYPKILTTSVVRGSQQGDSHGGIYLVDMETGASEQKVDWNDGSINFDGRGADRGLRGIAFYQENIYIAASDEIFIFDQDFIITGTIKNHYLRHCHEICVWQDRLFLTSTGFDSLLVYDLIEEKFSEAFYLGYVGRDMRELAFDPKGESGPDPSNVIHLNSVACDKNGVSFSGRKLRKLYRISGSGISVLGNLPYGTHNAQPFGRGMIYNDTENDQFCYATGKGQVTVPVPSPVKEKIENLTKYESKIARPGFGRGLAKISDHMVIGGTSPSTVALYDLDRSVVSHVVNISMDVRNAIHGLELWPYSY